jgi:uncharacterized membrane protein SpoIIM required for sporulation
VTWVLPMRIATMRPSFPGVAGFYGTALIVVVGCGAVAGCFWEPRVEANQLSRIGIAPVEAFRVIALENGRLWVYMCAGIASFGAAGFVVLVGNGLRFGLDATALARGAPEDLGFLLPHASLEFLAFTLAAAACQYLGWLLFDLLVFDRRRAPVGPGIRGLTWSFALMLLAALVEAASQMARVSGGWT